MKNLYITLWIWISALSIALIFSCNDCDHEAKKCADLSVQYEKKIADQETLIDEVMIENHFLDSVIMSIEGGMSVMGAFNEQIKNQSKLINALQAELDLLRDSTLEEGIGSLRSIE